MYTKEPRRGSFSAQNKCLDKHNVVGVQKNPLAETKMI